MTQTVFYAVPPRPVATTSPRTTKTPTAELTRLEIAADDCPQVLPRVLGLVARDGTIPVTIEAERRSGEIALVLELDGIGTRAGETLAHRIAGIPTVHTVRLAGRRIA